MYSLSVIVPIYNAEKYLSKTLDSLTAQTVADSMQLILVDDGSSDSSAAICDEFASIHPDTVVIHRKNAGVSAARNAGLKEATGEYVGFVDADDTLAPDYYEKLLTAAKENNCDMAFSSMTFVFPEFRRPVECWYPAGTVLDRDGIKNLFVRKMLSDSAQNSACVKVFRRSIIEQFSVQFPVGIKIGEDKRFILDFLRHCSSAVCTGDCGYYYLDVLSSATHGKNIIEQMLITFDDETEAFTAIGLDKQTVLTEKSAFLFYSVVNLLNKDCLAGLAQAKDAAKLYFADTELMSKLDLATDYIKANNGKIYSLLATAFRRRSVMMTIAVLFVQKIINSRSN